MQPPADAEVIPELTPVLNALRVLWGLNHHLEVRSSRMLRTLGVTAQQRMLLRVVECLEPVTAGTLARALHVHPGTLSASLRRLEERGLIVRRRDDGDGRRVVVSLTAAGKRIAKHVAGTVEEAVETTMQRLPTRQTESAFDFLHQLTLAMSEIGVAESKADGKTEVRADSAED